MSGEVVAPENKQYPGDQHIANLVDENEELQRKNHVLEESMKNYVLKESTKKADNEQCAELSERKWAASELQTALGNMLPLLLSRNVTRLDSQVEGVGSVTAYWVVDVLRIDITPIKE